MELNREDYYGWKRNPVTEAFMQAMVQEVEDEVGYLVQTAGKNSVEDTARRERIKALQWLIDWVPKFREEEREDA